MSPMAERFAEVGAPASLARVWFATLLRDGFALTAAGDKGTFADIGAEVLRGLFAGMDLDREPEAAVEHVMDGLGGLALHDDVIEGVRALKEAGFRLATLTNGSTRAAERLFSAAGIGDKFDLLLSVEDAPSWKPGKTAYEYAASACGASPGEMVLAAVHPWDIHGAARAGLRTAWVNRSGGRYPGYFAAPDHTVTGLDRLAEVLA
ncbi:haloacid dehalogenase type II [Arthrobacter halodurans]|uniref:Haloacid dehalogenase type II n=1 Tax=Arthrobacter halodurans TaxID=516699 RepID=A0ABV4UNS6_9MICC